MLKDLTPEQIDALNEEELEKTKNDYARFISKLNIGICDICGRKLTYFEKKNPCMHWLLRPKQFKKNHFPLVFNEFGYYRIQSFLRWLASSEAPFRNISDATLDEGHNKRVENTIVYKEFEWSFSSSKEDFKGHIGKYGNASKPHYHFQMRIDKKPFIDYSDFHIPFYREDMFYFDVLDGKFSQIKHIPFHGSSIQDAFQLLSPEDIIEHSKKAEPENAAFNMQILVTAKEGKKISGEYIQELVKKRNETGDSMAKLLKDNQDVDVKTIISPGEGVAEVAKRTPRKNKNS